MTDREDPRLTAYLVDEADAETASTLEATLQDSEELRRTAEEIRTTARLLSEAFAAEESSSLTPLQRSAVQAAARRRDRRAAVRLSPAGAWIGLAATLLIVGGLAFVRWRVGRVGPSGATTSATTAPTLPSRPSSEPTSAGVEAARSSRPQPAVAARPRPEGNPASLVTVAGVVSDPSGAILPGVTVVARSLTSGQSRSVVSNASGRFELKALPFGRLELKAALDGFQPMARITSAAPGAALAWNPRLQVATMSETITVTGDSPVLSSSAASTSVIGGMVGGLIQGYTRMARPVDFGLRRPADFNTESYAHRGDNDFLDVLTQPLSTFSVDVDTASYSNVRRFLNQGQLPPVDAVRLEELINYFPYDYPPPTGDEPLAALLEAGPAPWQPAHRLLRIGLKARVVDEKSRPDANLVFLLDVSGSMDEPNKLPLVQQSLRLLVDQLGPRDRVAIVVYAGAAGLVLPSTPASEKAVIRAALDRLQAGGSTNGAEGIELAYDVAAKNLVSGGVNRVVLATDGDFNVGTTDEGSLVRLIQEKAKAGVFLSVLGFGMGNYKDSTMEVLADKGNGNYAYIDTLREAQKALVEQMTGTLVTVAKDVKVQVEFNPAAVRAYRLLGYENRLLRAEEFNDDRKDAGEVGAGHAVTALYEIVPAGTHSSATPAEPLTYQTPGSLTAAARSGELLRVKVRYKEPDGETSRGAEWPMVDGGARLEETSDDYRFAASVAAFGMLLRDSPYGGRFSPADVIALAEGSRGKDLAGYRAELIDLIAKARPLLERKSQAPQP